MRSRRSCIASARSATSRRPGAIISSTTPRLRRAVDARAVPFREAGRVRHGRRPDIDAASTCRQCGAHDIDIENASLCTVATSLNLSP
ncbi:hypothetical protein CO709_30400 [Burkholderia thailandensis]|nr:hypothetical protein CO709_30400 [Burkholderia thailandensis]